MNIKDFKAGRTVYALNRIRGRTTKYFIQKYTVLSAGRKYVKAVPEGKRLPDEFYKVKDTDSFLTENVVWAERKKLFLTEAAAKDDIEKSDLQLWLIRAADNYKIETYTLEQLRAVREILSGRTYEYRQYKYGQNTEK